jgi:hypothetical protein
MSECHDIIGDSLHNCKGRRVQVELEFSEPGVQGLHSGDEAELEFDSAPEVVAAGNPQEKF